MVFSGRPDPTWPVDEKLTQTLEGIWDLLESTEQYGAPSPRLGYRGCYLRRAANRIWTAYNGLVTLTLGDRTESRHDPDRRFERVLLGSAPPSVIPPISDLIQSD